MRKNNIIRPVETSSWWRLGTVFLVLSFLMIESRAYSQETGFAGEDKAVYFDYAIGSVGVILGKTDYSDDVYYTWDTWDQPDGGYCEIDDYRASDPWVHFYVPGEYTFRCLQISRYGYRSEFVVVNVLSKIELVDVRVKSDSKCFTDSYPLLRDDFEFVTYPPNCESYIKIAPPGIVTFKNDAFWPFMIQEVEFMAIDENGDDYKCDITCKIPVVNDKKFLPFSEMSKEKINDINADMEEHVDMLDETMGGLSRLKCLSDPNYILPPIFSEVIVQSGDGVSTGEVLVGAAQVKNTGWAVWAIVKKVADKLKKFSNMIGPIPVAFYVDSSLDRLGLQFKCNDGDTYPEVYYNGMFAVTLGISVDCPLPYLAIPKVGGVHVRGAFSVIAKTENKSEEPLNPYNGDLKIPLQIAAEPAIGLSLLAVDADVLSGVALFKTTLTVDSYLNFNSMLKDSYCEECWKLSDNSWEFNKFSITASIETSVVLMGFTVRKSTYNLLEINTKDELYILDEKVE